MLDQFRHRFLGWWSRLVSRWPGWVLCVAAALAVASIAVAMGQLRFESNRNALIDDDLRWNQRFIAWRAQFPNTDDLVVVVDTHNAGGEPNAEAERRAQRLVDELGPRLDASEAVIEAVWGFDASTVHPRALRLEPMEEFGRYLDELAQAEPLLRHPTPADFLGGVMQRMRQGNGDEATAAAPDNDPAHDIARLERMIDAFTLRLNAPPDEPMDLARHIEPDAAAANEWRHLRSENGRLLLIRITPRADTDALNPYQEAIGAVRAILNDVRPDHPGVEFGLTGIKVIETDETAIATRDSAIASVVAVVLIALVLITAFHSFRMPMMLLAALAIGIGWSFGFLTLAIGHLQVISVVFVVLLLGLGIAFGIHLASGFELVRHAFPDTRAGFRDALQQTLETIGPGLLTGAVTTAAAFATTMFTDFRGVAEMGMIAGAGVILCLIAMCSVYPALLRLMKPGHKHFTRMDARRVHLFDPRWVMPFVRRPRTTLLVAALLTAMSVVAITQMRFDYNLMALMPRDVDSVRWQQRIVDQGGQSVWAATSITDSFAEAQQRAERFRALPTVESVGGVGRLFPHQSQQRHEMIETTRHQLGEALTDALTDALNDERTPTDEDALSEQISALRFTLTFGAWGAPAELQPRLNELGQSLDALAQTIASLPEDERAARLAALDRDYQQWRQEVARLIDQALAPGDVQPGDLPQNLLAPYFGRGPDGEPRFALEVYPRLPEGVEDALEPPFLSQFLRDIYSVDSQATGVVVQIYESGTLIRSAYLWAGVYALLAVFVIVAVDFQSLRDAGLVLVPVAVGFTITFAVMYLVGLNINPANIMVLPLMFGIGVDAGVHVMHRYRQSPYHQPPGLSAGTGKGITLTSLTTMIGFGTLMLASHRGIAGLGFVLAVGIGMTLLACWTIMPAWLELRNRRRQRIRQHQPTTTPEPVNVG